MKELPQFREMWSGLWKKWRDSSVNLSPLDSSRPDILDLEAKLMPLVVAILNAGDAGTEELFVSARAIRDQYAGRVIKTRAAVDISNVCRINCSYCPMRRDNLRYVQVNRATVEQVVFAARAAYAIGFRHLFLQSGEDPLATDIAISALRILGGGDDEWHFVLNLGNLSQGEYRTLREAGAHGYLIKHETANSTLHLSYRGETLQKRIRHALWAREAGLYVGSGNILGLPGQTDEDLADDLIFLGRFNSSEMASCAPFTSSDELPTGFRDRPAGDFEKTKRFIALLRHCFPTARIPATSNLDSDRMTSSPLRIKSGQAEAIEAGANGITVQFTPAGVEKDYGLYERGPKRHLVYLAKAEQVARETGLPLDLIR